MKDYSVLPDGMPLDAVAAEFERALAEINAQPSPGDNEAVTALCELAARQWHTYRLLRDDLRAAIEEWVHSHWRTDSDEYVGQLICLIGSLGLQSLMPRLEAALAGLLPGDVRQTIQEYLEETNGDVTDPFRGMKQTT